MLLFIEHPSTKYILQPTELLNKKAAN